MYFYKEKWQASSIHIWIYSLITILFLLDTSSVELRFHFLFHSLGSDGDTNFSFFLSFDGCRKRASSLSENEFSSSASFFFLIYFNQCACLLSANMENTSKKKGKLTLIRIVHFFDDGNNLYFFVHGRRGIFICVDFILTSLSLYTHEKK